MADQRTILLVVTPGSGIDIDHPYITRTLAAFREMNVVVPLTRFEFRWRDATNPPVYDYEFDAADGRTWKQVLTFTEASPPMTFDVPPPGWKVEEFAPQRAIRDLMVSAANGLGIRRLRIRWEVV